jgi:hypothetical protein
MSEWLPVTEKTAPHNKQQGKLVMYQDLLNICERLPGRAD